MDIAENYLNVLPLEFFGDAKLWANVGDDQIHTYQDLMDEVTQLVDFQVVDLSKYDYEIYLYEQGRIHGYPSRVRVGRDHN